jgi:hypothetical protein
MYFYKKANASAKVLVVCGIWKLETNWERS